MIETSLATIIRHKYVCSKLLSLVFPVFNLVRRNISK